MSVSQTSKEAFEKIKPTLGKRQSQVFEAIRMLGKPSNQEIANFLRLQINQVTPRVNELLKFGVIQHEITEKNAQGMKVKKWSIKGRLDQQALGLFHDE